MDIRLDTTFGNSTLPVIQRPGFVDTFSGIDGDLLLTEDGKTWSHYSASGTPMWVRSSGVAVLKPSGPSTFAIVDGLASDGVLTQTIGTVGTLSRGQVVFRFVDQSNHLYLDWTDGSGNKYYKCKKYKEDVTTTLFTTTVASDDDDVITVEMDGNNVAIEVNGSPLGDFSTSDFATSTKHGMFNSVFDYTCSVASMEFVAAT